MTMTLTPAPGSLALSARPRVEPAVASVSSGAVRRAPRLRAAASWGLVGLDAAALLAAFGLAYLIRFKAGVPGFQVTPYSGAYYALLAFGAVPVWLVLFATYRLYERGGALASARVYGRLVNACTAGVVALVMLSFLGESLAISRGWLLLTWGLSIGFVGFGRFAAGRTLWALRARGRLATPTLIVGTNQEGLALAEQFAAQPGGGVRVLGLVEAEPLAPDQDSAPFQVLGSIEHVEELVRRLGVTRVVVATTAVSREQLLDLYRTFATDDSVELRLSSGLFEILTTGVEVQEVARVPLIAPRRVRITGLDALLKSAIDFGAAAVALLLLSPLMLVLAALVRLDSSGPAFHRRRVLGVSGKPFDAFKFRTMVVDADAVLARDARLLAEFAAGYKLKRDPRVTRLGAFLRRTSLDELPQLLNVLRGEMSLVGPRMIAPEEAVRYGQWRWNLLTVKPGITGPWQIEGRNDLPYDERVRLSMDYIRNHTFWLDVAILLRTVVVVLKGRGAY